MDAELQHLISTDDGRFEQAARDYFERKQDGVAVVDLNRYGFALVGEPADPMFTLLLVCRQCFSPSRPPAAWQSFPDGAALCISTDTSMHEVMLALTTHERDKHR